MRVNTAASSAGRTAAAHPRGDGGDAVSPAASAAQTSALSGSTHASSLSVMRSVSASSCTAVSRSDARRRKEPERTGSPLVALT